MGRVLLVDDDRANIDLVSEILSKEGHSVQMATDGETALHRIKAWKPQILLMNVGADLIPKIREVTQDNYVSIVLIMSDQSSDNALLGVYAGADDFIAKPFLPQQLVLRVRTMLRFKDLQDGFRRANHRIDELISTDDLTGLMNMRTLQRKAEEEIQRARRFKKPVSALLVNLDEFSKVNHELGFVAGSSVIQEMGQRIRKCLRSIDMVARVGADEFFILMAETDLANAEFMAERIRDAIQSDPYKDSKRSAHLTASVGVSTISPDHPDEGDRQMSDLFHLASEALRSAKAGGRNRVEIYSIA